MLRALAEGTDFMYDPALMAANTGSAKAPTDTKDASGCSAKDSSSWAAFDLIQRKKMHVFGK